MRKQGARLAFIDALKAITSQLIVLHHLALYGPLAKATHKAVPGLSNWLTHDARAVVQIFLVIGGFLAAKSLAPEGLLVAAKPFAQIRKRYLKLTLPFIVALLISVLCTVIARLLFNDAMIPGPPSLQQFFAHVVLLSGVLGFDSLTTGVWYVAIDFQLFVLLLCLLWLAHRFDTNAMSVRVAGALLMAIPALASLFYFNRLSTWDNWAIYFFGAYSLGVLAFWLSNRRYTGIWLLGVSTILAIVGIALWFDYRTRILVALMTALALTIACRYGFIETWPKNAIFGWLGKISYAVFLVHFPLLLIVNAAFSHTEQTVGETLVFSIIAWMLSIGAGTLFHQYVECRAYDWQGRLVSRLTDWPDFRSQKPDYQRVCCPADNYTK